MSLTFQDVLAREDVDPCDVNVLLHSPMDRQFAALMPGLARTRRGIIEAYGATHSKPVERALHKGRRWVAICLQTGRSALQSRQRMLFLGLYENRGGKPKTHAQDGARYVGSAYGAENILGRWLENVSGNSGVTVGLADRDPATFRFSILERLNPDASPDDVILREQTWMDRLHTARFGLNRPKPRSPEGERT